MKLTVSNPTRQDFVNALTGPQLAHIFTEAGASALYDYYSDLSYQTGEEFYLDRDAIRDQWTEWSYDHIISYMDNCGDGSCVIDKWLSVNREHWIRVQSESYVGYVITRN